MNSWQISQLKYAFGIGGLMSFYGVVGLIVWILGDQFGYTGSQRVVVIALILLTLPFTLLIGFVVARRGKKKAASAAAVPQTQSEASVGGSPKLSAPTGNYDDISRGAEEAVQFLKSSNLGDGGKDAVYGLPWYLIAGTPRAGKSSLVLGSNLNFQTLPGQRQSEQKTVRPTPNIDWRVTSDGVFVDTAGRYQTEGIDADEWSAVLETVRKYRPNRPLDGFLLVADAEKILNSDEREIEEMAKVLRARLDEAVQRLKVRFPVYLVFTHADSIEGFRDSFSASKNEGKTLVWGSTIPLEKSENAQALFDGEFEILHTSLMKRRLARLSAPFPPVRQLRIFNFPLHFGAARKKFGTFVNMLFRPNPFSENPFLRGFYFTAAPAGKQASNSNPAANGYFSERMFRDVVLRDKDLVRTFQAQRQRPPIFGWAMTFLGALLVFALLVASGVSLAANKSLLDDAQARGQKVITIAAADAGKNVLEKKPDDVRRELTAADELRSLLVTLDDYERNGAPLYMRFGMYSGNRVYKQHLLPIYMGMIEQRFKAPTIRRVEAELRKFAAGQSVANPSALTDAEEQNLGKNYDLLKAYLMLSGKYKANAEASHISNTLKDYWVSEAKLPGDLNLTAQQQLEFWAKQVDRDDDAYRFPRISTDDKLVADVRGKLQAFPAVYRYYKRKVTEISKQVDDSVGKTSADAILTRSGADASFIEGTYVVPSAYTKPGYALMKTAIAEADQKLSEDDWVMGESGKGGVAQATDASKIEERYFRDYADHWRNFVKGIEIRQYKNREEAASALQAFASANSPIKILMIEIVKNTNLSAKTEPSGWWEWLKSFIESKTSTDTGGNTPVEKEFRPLFSFVGTKEQADNAPIEKYQNEINNVYKALNAMSPDQFREAPKQIADNKDSMKLQQREGNIGDMTKGFAETPSGQEAASLLQKPLGRLRELFGADAKSQLAKAWTDQILPAAKEIEKGYPFEEGQAEADLTKLTAFLNPTDGKLSKFYDERLSKFFEESNGQLKVKDTSEVKFSDEFVAYLNSAFNLRKILYGTSATPKFEYEFNLRPTSGAIIEVSIDGQKIGQEGTGSFKGTFPGSGSETGVAVNLAGSGGEAPASANSENANVSSSGNPQQPANANPSGSALTYPGTWGLFKFVDAGRPQKQAGGEYLLTYSVGGRPMTATIRPSGGDLFDKNVFRQMKAPQNFIK